MNRTTLAIIAAVAVAVIAGGAWLALRGGGQPQGVDTVFASDNPVLAPRPGDRVLGAADAPLTIIEYASFTCPHCGSFHTRTLPQVETDWITTGRARFIFRDFPGDQLALMAAMTARCLPEPQYYPFVALLFREQEAWLSSEDPVAFVSRVAATAGMDAASLDGCLADRNLQNDILSHQIAARDALGVASTPTIFVNGRRVVGDLSYDDLNRILDDAAGS